MEAFNLRAAIEHTRKNYDMAIEALSDMPPRREQELDPVTLHNQACIPQSCDVKVHSTPGVKALISPTAVLVRFVGKTTATRTN